MPDSSAHPPPPRPPGPRGQVPRSIGGYEIEGELGRGGMGVVYLARQIKLNRRVALKMLTGHYGPDELQRFLAEAETAAGLHHTNIAHIYEVGEHEGAPFFSMEHIEGGSLADRLRKGLPTPREAAQLLIAVARALHFAHQNGVVHRDMKPGNVLLDTDGVPKVADFGIAKRLAHDTKLTLSGAVVGTPTYMAPEQARGSSRDAGPAADVYSLGAILYETLTGRPPFLPEESATAVTVRVLTEDPVSPAWHRPEIPRDLEVICMKCLEKEPRDRYASAAAFAEDLRRFLDDEAIVARPPTTAVRTIKWIRRHPWKFVTRAALLLLLIGGFWRLWQWEFYERTHLEYAVAMDYRFGGPVPVASLSASELKHRGASLRFTRRGRLGPVDRVESLNARQHPSNMYQFFGHDPLPNLIEGGLAVRDAPSKTRETTRIDFVYEDRVAIEATGRDCNGTINWRVIYDRPSSKKPRRVHGRYVTYRGFDFASSGGASLIEAERDPAGHDIKVTFFNGSGQPATNSEGVYGYALERDGKGRLARLTNLDKDGKPGPNRAGQIGLLFQRNARGLVIRSEFRDAAGQPASNQGISLFTTDYDATANDVRVTRLGLNGHPTNGDGGDWAARETVRNDRGEAAEIRLSSADYAGQLSHISTKTIAYDANGYPADIRFTGRTNWRTALQCDDRGNLLEEKLLGDDGQPVAGSQGWAIHRHAWQFSAEGVREEETWFDAQDKPTYDEYGEHRRVSEIDASGNLRRLTTDEHDPARYTYQRYVSEPEYNAQGKLLRMSIRFEDAKGQLATGAGLPYTARELTMDENEREILEWKLGCDVKEVGAPVLRTDTEWQRSGAHKRTVRQACDENRKPLAVISNGTAARFEQEFNEIDRLERINETGFDEKLVGFSSREAKFASGELQSVTHRRSDGTALASVRVMIKSIIPQQAKAKELRAGDQLLATNDNPVTSAYGWVAAGNFPGGWIEVLRDGKRLRIEGFEAGPIGMILEDRE